ncbi:MAG: undecaprenyl/decaprenyl-phosphate alpha-N-acetylglucosaminyl 1-phosphate transferase [Firmicutes bacterium]|nr:undecaprenyl/decaprenyl-phosphate alpha-N-acetylglucosaminyl 1-phosphate transferase [Bacillota bacterium]
MSTRVLLALAVSTSLSLLFTPVVRQVALKLDIVDRPRRRHVHDIPTPLLGGVAMYAAFVIAALLTAGVDRNTFGVLVGGAVAVLLGVADDKWELRPRTKFLGQLLAACAVMFVGDVRIEFVTNPFGGMIYLSWLSGPLTVLWIAAFMNVVNFMDGLDGLAAGVTIIGAVAMAFAAGYKGQPRLIVLSVALIGSALGFLRYNFHPASIFMGDSGAMFLGLTVAGLSAMGALKTPATLVLAVPVLVMGVPIIDTAFAILRRVRKGVSFSQRDLDHVHHRLLAMGLSHTKAVLTVYAVSACLAVAACGVVVADTRIGTGGALAAFGVLILLGDKSGLLKLGSGDGKR